jgi:hypothetical protein
VFLEASASELDHMPSQLTAIEIEALDKREQFQIKFTATLDWAWLEVSGSHPASTEAVSKIKKICKNRRLRLRSLAQTHWLNTIIFTLGTFAVLQLVVRLVAAFVAPPEKHGWNSYGTVLYAIDLTVFIFSLGWLIVFLNPKTVVDNALQSERPTYWQRTREAWWIALATTLIGVVLGYVLSRWTPW